MASIKYAVVVGLLAVSFAFGQGSDPFRPEASRPSQGGPDLPARDINAQTGSRKGYVRPDPKTRLRRYVMRMFGPTAIGKSALSAGWSTWRDSPEEWGDQWKGFGKRFASSLGQGVIKHSAIYGLDEALKYDSHFYRSEKRDVSSRITNALLSPVTARDKDGKRVVGVPRLVGTYSSSIIAAETWYPARLSYKDGLKNGTVSLGMNAVFNLIKEFVWKK